MNISDLIVELLQKGQKVEIPGIGTLESVMKQAYHDPKTSTFYPARHTVVFSEEQTGDMSIVKTIGEKECVSEEVAMQMWRNYVDALTDRIKGAGSHTFMGLGTISTKDKRSFSFRVADDLMLDDDSDEVPLTDVKIYSHEGEEDPFAQFDDEVPVVEDKSEAEAIAKKAEEERIEQEKRDEEERLRAEREAEMERLAQEKKADEERRKAEEERIKQEKRVEEERLRAEREAEEARLRAEREAEKERLAQEKKAAEEQRKAEEERLKQEKKAAEEQRKAEEERYKQEKRAEEERIKADKKAAALAAVAARQQAQAEQRAEEERLKAEKKAAKAEQKAEEERIKLEKRAEEERLRAEREMEKERLAKEKKAAEEMRKAEEEMRKAEKKAEEERIKSDREAEAARFKAEKKAEEERIKAEKKAAALAAVAARQQARAEQKAKEDAERTAKAESRAQEKAMRKAEKEAAKQSEKNRRLADELLSPTPYTEEKKEKKRRSVWPIILIILLLLALLAGAAYYFLLKRQAAKPAVSEVPVATAGKHLDVPAVNSLTFNTDMIEYSNREVNANADRVCRNMDSYISDYLFARGYAGARVPMMERVREYSNQRMSELMDDQFAVQRLIPYNDYIYKFNEPCLRAKRANNARIKVQTELMNYSALDDILYNMVDELGIKPDSEAAKKTAAEVKQVKADEKKVADKKKKAAVSDETPVFVYVAKDSKQGFDLIAGFYLNRSTAANLTARLHEQGCDAYIIEKNDLYYVSMGSASTRTAAEALYKHVKSWYDGDVVIKEW